MKTRLIIIFSWFFIIAFLGSAILGIDWLFRAILFCLMGVGALMAIVMTIVLWKNAK